MRHEQPHQQRCGDGKATLIEESDGDETKNQIGASPEPNVLMKHVEYDDSNNEQDVLHGGEKVSSPFGECQEKEKGTTKRHILIIGSNSSLCAFCAFCGSTTAEGFGPQSCEMMRIDVVTLDHAIESLAIDGQHARRGLFVATRVFEHTRDVTSFDYR